jgi:DNA-directed RNA polymerase specialized sigma24 family protein
MSGRSPNPGSSWTAEPQTRSGVALTEAELEDLLRRLASQVLGALVRRYGHFDAAEDATQESLIAAASQWPREGAPDNPRGWLITVASRRLTDLLRAEQARQRREDTAARWELAEGRGVPSADKSPADADDTLILLFMCCHPALSSASQIALTLRAVGGLATAAIARAFLVPESAMTRRISRAKQQIKASAVPFRMPAARFIPAVPGKAVTGPPAAMSLCVPGRPGAEGATPRQRRLGLARLVLPIQAIPRRHPMSDPDTARHVEVKDEGQTVAAAEVTTAKGPEGTARTSLHAMSPDVSAGHRSDLVDAVMDSPEVQASTRLEATIPLGDGELLERLRQRTTDAVTRPAGSTTLLDANIPEGAHHGDRDRQPRDRADPEDL